MEDDSNVRVNKLKGQRKPRAKKEEPEAPAVEVEVEAVEEEAPAPAPAPKKTTKKAAAEEYDVEREPDVVIHKRHKGAKPRKIIVITGDSSADEDDETMPYRKAPKVEIKKRDAPKPRSPSPPPRPPRKQNVGLVAGDPKKEHHDSGKGVSQPHAKPNAPKTFVVDSFIDGLLGL